MVRGGTDGVVWGVRGSPVGDTGGRYGEVWVWYLEDRPVYKYLDH